MSIFKKILTGFNFVGNSIKNAKLIEVCAEVVTELPSEESSGVGRYVYYNGDLWCYDGSHWDKVQTEIKQVQLSDGTAGSISDGIITIPAISGIKGPTGTQGAQGFRGVQGYTGTQGSQGSQGPQGDPGSGIPFYTCDTLPGNVIKQLSLVYGEEPSTLYDGFRISVRFTYINGNPNAVIELLGSRIPIHASDGTPPVNNSSWAEGSVVDLVLTDEVWYMTSPSMPLPGPQGNRGFQGYQGDRGFQGLPAESITWNLIQSLFKEHGIILEEGKISTVDGSY